MFFLLCILHLLCAVMFIGAKAVLSASSPFFFVGIRMFYAGLMLLGYELWCSGRLPRIVRKDWWLCIQLILFHIYLTYVCDLWALQYMNANKEKGRTC